MALLFFPSIAWAAVEITHVEYDLPGSDEGREWVEITNKGTAEIDLSGFRFLEGGTKHKLTLAQGSWVLASGASAVIASDATTFLSEHPGFAESIYKSSFSLSNTGETIALINTSGAIENSLTYKATPVQKTIPPPASPKSSTAKSSSSSSAKKSSGNTATAAAPVFAQVDDTPGLEHSTQPAMVWWYAGLAGIIALGVAGVVYARLQPTRLAATPETKRPSEEFEIV